MKANRLVLLATAAMCAAALHAAVTEQPAVPVGNPDDQLRFFWGLDWRMYDSLPPAGFNMAAEHSLAYNWRARF